MAISPAPTSTFDLPASLLRLGDVAYNLAWSWDEDAFELFRNLEPLLWESTDHNPVRFLRQIPTQVIETAATNPEFLHRLEVIADRIDRLMNSDPGETWVGQHAPHLLGKTLAYFSAEFGLHRALPIYSGGLGVLAGDHIKEASDLGLPLVAVSLLYRKGYLSQRLTHDGWQTDVPADLEPWEEPTVQVMNPDGSPCIVEIVLDQPDQPLKLAIWKVQVGRVPLFLLDADVDGNPDWTRAISSRLYGGDTEHRLRQELILGIGGVRALRAMGFDPVYWHANEGHAGFHLLERVREYVSLGMTFEEASELVRVHTVFTSHTPVPAGHDLFSPDMMDRYFGHFWPSLNIDRDNFLALGRYELSGDNFNMTALSLRLAQHRNGVSEKHGEVTRQMWFELFPGLPLDQTPITSVTNGVHMPTWISDRVDRMLVENGMPDWRDRQHEAESWDRINQVPDSVFWETHLEVKRDLFHALRERTRRRWTVGGVDPGQVLAGGPFLKDDILTFGFARRFATYKRANLLFHDPERLARILMNPERPVQIIWAGKAHPADEAGKRLIQEIFWHARDPRFGGRIAFAEDYDMGLASYLVAGVDVWLNNPRAPLEASGTSGMKAGANGVPNLSILDGWWIEGWHEENPNGWGVTPSSLTGESQDAAEAHLIYDLIEHKVAPAYYNRGSDGIPNDFVRIEKESLRTVGHEFSARRMLTDYIANLYTPAALGKK